MTYKTGLEFIEKTKYQHMKYSEQDRGLPQPDLEDPFSSNFTPNQLPDPSLISNRLKEIIDRRASLRTFRDDPISPLELSYLLWCTQGIRKRLPYATLRTVPSAGARHAFETYILVNRVEGFEPGLYRYLAGDHQIQEYIRGTDIAMKITQASGGQEFLQECAVTFLWVAIVNRMTWRYQERGYRYLFLDAGHVCQNLYLATESIDCGACAVAAFDDDKMNTLLGLDGIRQFVIYLAAVGKR